MDPRYPRPGSPGRRHRRGALPGAVDPAGPRRSAGGGPIAGRRAPTRTSPPKDPHHGALHRPTAVRHGDLRRRAGPGDPARLPAHARLVTRRVPDQGATGVCPRPGEDLAATPSPAFGHVFIPTGACWLNRREGWWRIFRKTTLAGQSFPGHGEITHGTQVATAQLNARDPAWIWGDATLSVVPMTEAKLAQARLGWSGWSLRAGDGQ